MSSRQATLLTDLSALTKPVIGSMVVMTTFVGYQMALSRGGEVAVPEAAPVLAALFGVFCLGSASSVLNQVMERSHDARMPRTKDRPLPSGRVSVASATAMGIVLSLAGTLALGLWTNLLTTALGVATLLAYLCLYTPLKRRTKWNTWVGAVPGAMPPVLGWTAATGQVDALCLVVFGCMFLWQLPHFYSIAWLYRRDYRLGGFHMVTRDDETGEITARKMMRNCLALVVVSALPPLLGDGGAIYLIGVLLAGAFFFAATVGFWTSRTRQSARRVLTVSLLYMPCLFGLFAFGL